MKWFLSLALGLWPLYWLQKARESRKETALGSDSETKNFRAVNPAEPAGKAFVLEARRKGQPNYFTLITTYRGDDPRLLKPLPKDGVVQPDGSRVFSSWQDADAYRNGHTLYQVHYTSQYVTPRTAQLSIFTGEPHPEWPENLPTEGTPLYRDGIVYVFPSEKSALAHRDAAILVQLAKWVKDGTPYYYDDLQNCPLEWVCDYGYVPFRSGLNWGIRKQN